MSTAAIARETRKALNKAIKAGSIPDTEYEVKLRKYQNGNVVTVRLVGPLPTLKLFNPHYLYERLVPLEQRPADYHGRGYAYYSPNWFALQGTIVKVLRDEHIKAAESAPGDRENDVQVVDPTSYVAHDDVPQYRAELGMRAREARLVQAAFPDQAGRILFLANEGERDAAVKRAASSAYADYLDFDPTERGWRRLTYASVDVFEKREWRGLHAVVNGIDRTPGAKHYTPAHPMNGYDEARAWRTAAEKGTTPGLVPFTEEEMHDDYSKRGGSVPPEATHAWVVYDYRPRARRYDKLAAGWTTSLEGAILDAEAAAGPSLKDPAGERAAAPGDAPLQAKHANDSKGDPMPDPAPKPVDLEHLSDEELLALLIGKAPARRLLKAVEGELARLARYSLPELEAEGLSSKAAKNLLAALTAGRRVSGTPLKRGVHVADAYSAYLVLKPLMAHLPREKFVALLVDAHGKLISARVISTGTLAATLVPMRDLFAPAIREHAHSLIVAHNHPSGGLVPSPEDLALTSRLVAAGNAMSIPVNDHLILSDADYTSLRETRGYLWTAAS